MTDTLTPKQALSALSALDNALAALCDGEGRSPYSRRPDGLAGAPTVWETEALFRLRIALLCQARPAMLEPSLPLKSSRCRHRIAQREQRKRSACLQGKQAPSDRRRITSPAVEAAGDMRR